MSFSYTPIADFEKRQFSAPISGGSIVIHDVYTRGAGAPVVIIQELPGIGTETLRLADRFVERGFQVVLPHLFGPLERTSMLGNLARVFCLRREFSIFSNQRSSPIVDWLRALCQDVRNREKVEGVGVIGMCLTGNFAISLMADDSVLAAVASQPSLPIFQQDKLHMNPEEIEEIKQGIDAKAPMYSYRFEGDSLVQQSKFNCIHETFNTDGHERIKLRTLPGGGHSVLTLDFVDREGEPTYEALQEVLGYFSEQLQS